MNRTPIIIAIILSVIAHIVVGETAMQFKGDPPGKRRVTVAVVGAEKKKAEEPKPPPPPPPPPPVAPKVARAAPKAEAPPPEAPPEPVHEAAPVAAAPSGLEFSNTSGAGVDVGGPVIKKPEGGDATHVPKPGAVKKPQAVVKPATPEGGNDSGDGPAACTEEPTKPEAIAKTEIEYTEEARASGVEGRLVLNISIDANGAVTNVAVASSVDPALDAAAIAAVKQWRFKPSTRCGKPVAGSYKLARRFELGD
ncbi:MAG: energy transducer TonB [Deltaproteobacteria bacterium]|nr:energy transducer TonB [Deltaproteobacteria bacterium]